MVAFVCIVGQETRLTTNVLLKASKLVEVLYSFEQEFRCKQKHNYGELMGT